MPKETFYCTMWNLSYQVGRMIPAISWHLRGLVVCLYYMAILVLTLKTCTSCYWGFCEQTFILHCLWDSLRQIVQFVTVRVTVQFIYSSRPYFWSSVVPVRIRITPSAVEWFIAHLLVLNRWRTLQAEAPCAYVWVNSVLLKIDGGPILRLCVTILTLFHKNGVVRARNRRRWSVQTHLCCPV